MLTQIKKEPAGFSYLAVLSLVTRRVISLDRREDEIKELITYLVGEPVEDTSLHGKPCTFARRRLFSQFHQFCPECGEVAVLYESLERHLERGQVREPDVRNYLLIWASDVRKALNLPEMIDFGS